MLPVPIESRQKKRIVPVLVQPAKSVTTPPKPSYTLAATSHTKGRMVEDEMLKSSAVIGPILRKMEKTQELKSKTASTTKPKSTPKTKEPTKIASPKVKTPTPILIVSKPKKKEKKGKKEKKEKKGKKENNCKIMYGQGGRRYVLDYNKKKVYLDSQHRKKNKKS